ncbi:MAG: dihydrofolate reductase family protein, partial [Acidobacteriota bacterium]
GRIATASGESQWISAPEGRRWALGEREHHDAILIGRGTAVTDDPRLDRRLGRALGPNLRVVLDRQLRIGPDARLFTVDGPICLYAEQPDGDDAATDAWRARRDALVARGAEVVVLVHVTPKTVLADLHTRGVQSVLVEGGGEVHGAFLAAGAFDRVAVDCAPRLIGGAGAPGPIGDPGFARLDDAPRLDSPRLLRRGGDVIMEAFHERCLPDLYASVDGS